MVTHPCKKSWFYSHDVIICPYVHTSSPPCTVPCKLTVPRSSIRETRSSILENFKDRGLSRVSRRSRAFQKFSRQFSRLSSGENKGVFAWLIFHASRPVYFIRLLFYLTVGFHHSLHSSETLARHVSVFTELFCVLLIKKCLPSVVSFAISSIGLFVPALLTSTWIFN